MKKILLLILFSFSAHLAFAEEYLDRIGQRTCECVGKIGESDSKETKKLQLLLGLCIMQSLDKDDKKKFRADFGLDIETDQEKIGKKVGEIMISQCPSALVKIFSTDHSGTTSGVVTKFENESFVVFHIRERSGAVSKFIWLYPVESTIDLPSNYQTLIGKNVDIRFETKEIFDPKIGEYRSFKVITRIK